MGDLFNRANLKVKINGISSLANFTFENNHQKYKTLITQEMLKNNILASNIIYCSIHHNDKILNKYFFHLEKILEIIKM